jgi:hypothetical protein
MQTEATNPQLESIDDAQLSTATGGSVASTIAKIGAEGLPLLQSALPVIANTAAVIEGLVKKK